MGYVNKDYLKTQFENFASKLSIVFSKIGHKHTTSDITDYNAVETIKINGESKSPTEGEIDLGTVITEHQDISNKMDKVNPTGSGSLSLNRKTDSTIGDYSVALGYSNEASGMYSYAEGTENLSLGTASHSEGGKWYSPDSPVESVNGITCTYISKTLLLSLSSNSKDYSYKYKLNTDNEDILKNRYININNPTEGTSKFYLILDKYKQNDETYIELYCPSSYNQSLDDVSTFDIRVIFHTSLKNLALGYNSHVEGLGTLAGAADTHAEGVRTSAIGLYSHTEGCGTVAFGQGSHAEGYYTIANGKNQHAMGKYNVQDDSDTYSLIVGNGTSTSARSNAYTLDWGGNGFYSGDVTSTSGETTYSLNTVGSALDDTVSKSAPVISGTQLKSTQLTDCGNEQVLSALKYNDKYRMWLGNPKLEMLNLEVNGNSYNVESLVTTLNGKPNTTTLTDNPKTTKVVNGYHAQYLADASYRYNATELYNALAGKVSTSDYANGSGTVNTTYIEKKSSTGVTWARWGKIVVVHLYDIYMKSTCVNDQSTSVIASGLPKAKYGTVGMITSNTTNSSATSKRIGIASGGTTITFWWTGTVSATTSYGMTGQLIYIAE